MTIPKKRQISGILNDQFPQFGKEFFGLFPRYPKVKGIGAKVYFLAPGNFAPGADMDLLELPIIIP